MLHGLLFFSTWTLTNKRAITLCCSLGQCRTTWRNYSTVLLESFQNVTIQPCLDKRSFSVQANDEFATVLLLLSFEKLGLDMAKSSKKQLLAERFSIDTESRSKLIFRG